MNPANDDATRDAAEIAALSSESLHALLDAVNVAYVSLRPYDRVDG